MRNVIRCTRSSRQDNHCTGSNCRHLRSGLFEGNATTDFARMQEQLASIDEKVAFPEVEDTKLNEATVKRNTTRKKDSKNCSSHRKWNQQKPGSKTDNKVQKHPGDSNLNRPRTIDSRRKKRRKKLCEVKKGTNGLRLQPKDSSTKKSNPGSTRMRKMDNQCRNRSQKEKAN